MSHTLPPLPYSFDALEPYIDAKTMEIHHDKHHDAYVTNLNKALEGQAPDLQNLSVEELLAQIDKVPENIRTAVRNNGGGHMNHSMFWKIMKKGGGGEPSGDLAECDQECVSARSRISRRKFNAAATTRFGSGWAWLLVRDGKLVSRINCQSGQSDSWTAAKAVLGTRRVGTRLLPEVSEPPAGIHRGMVECDELGASRGKLRRRKEVRDLSEELQTAVEAPHFLGRFHISNGASVAAFR